MEDRRTTPDPWWVVCGASGLLVCLLLFVADRYVELLGAFLAYAATWAIARRERPDARQEEIP
jgi:hypothetical protein